MKRTDHLLLLKDHEIAELINALRDAAEEYGRAQQLRAAFARIVKGVVVRGEINYKKEREL
ncbi:MAG: hypothetical protein ACRCZ6_15035 [Kluyvera sp.]|uniref:hypothetical protein n=1 Tax=Kluyvera sp. TaxID=1538228 RepID=UPI003F331B90